MFANFESLIPSLPFILKGFGITLGFTISSLLSGFPIAILLACCKVSSKRYLNGFANFYTSLFRGTPLLVQLGLIYYSTPELTGYNISAFEAGVLTFALNSGAYASEVIRAGIQAIDIGQWEAAYSLGLTKRQTLIKIIFPQAIRNIVPSLINEMIDLLKESALVSTIGEADLMHRIKLVTAEKFLYFEPYILAALLYYCVIFILSILGKKIEEHLKYA